ncbi:MAG: mannosyltransferase family protein [Acidimicrobiales bacterium]
MAQVSESELTRPAAPKVEGVVTEQQAPSVKSDGAIQPGRSRVGRLVEVATRLRFPLAVYLASRLLLIGVALFDGAVFHRSLAAELSNWDGVWYLRVATRWYPSIAVHGKSTLGFFPLYPMVMWAVSHALFIPLTLAGLLISGIGGFVSVVLVTKLARLWWGDAIVKKATLWFCLFPGSVVFSMVYSEGLLIPLAAGCLLALHRKRWVLAGICAGVATAVGPNGIILIVVCAVAVARVAKHHGLGSSETRKSLAALLCSPAGFVGFCSYLWVRTGTPLAFFWAQRNGWGEQTEPLALLHQAQYLANEISFSHFSYHLIDWNLVSGLFGAAFLAVAIYLLLRRRNEIAPEAIAWVLGIAFLTVTSEHVPPNPRMLLTAFPAVLVFTSYLRARGYQILLGAGTALLIVMSALTYVGYALRP